jgi:peptide/nickel transport system permease protein
MSDEEAIDGPATPSATKTPLEDAPALRDPAAVGLVPAAAGGGVMGTLDSSARTIRRENLRLLVRSPAFLIGAVILLWWIVCALFGKTIAPYNPVAGSLTAFNEPPSGAHWFGTDSLGRDVLSRVIVGARDILIVAPLATLLGTALGTTIGLVQGYFRGRVDSFSSRLVEAVLALPLVVVAFLFVVALGPSAPTLIIVIGLVFGVLISRTVRTAVLQERDLDYIAAARLRDESNRSHHVRRDTAERVGPILVEFTVRLGYAIFTIATLSFLGFGIQPPTPDWGADIANSYQYLGAGYWWAGALPGAGDRLAGGRHQPHCRLHRGGAHPVTTDAPSIQAGRPLTTGRWSTPRTST